MKYKIFLSDSIEVLKNEELLGEANDYKEASAVIELKLQEKGLYQEPYWRFLMDSTATFIDFGSWSKFIAIVPPISMAEIVGEDE